MNPLSKSTLATELSNYDTEYQVVRKADKKYQNALNTFMALSQIQTAYKNITSNMKNNRPNDRESYLTATRLEPLIYDNLTFQSALGIHLPDQKALPLFRRGAEKQRRAQLDTAIKQLNALLCYLTRLPDIPWSDYRGKLLDGRSLERANRALAECRTNATLTKQEFTRTHRRRQDIVTEIRAAQLVEHTKQAVAHAMEQLLATTQQRMARASAQLIANAPHAHTK